MEPANDSGAPATGEPSPKISVNKLAEYLVAGAVRRRAILKDQKYPDKFVVVRYADAREFSCQYFSKGFDVKILEKGIGVIDKKGTSNAFQQNDKDSSLQALRKLKELPIQGILREFEITPINGQLERLNISGVDISVFPDLFIKGDYKKKAVVGAVKLHIIKTNSLTEEAQKYVATIVYQYVEKYFLDDDVSTTPDICLSIDIFSGKVVPAPKSNTRRRYDIQAACEEIAAIWASI